MNLSCARARRRMLMNEGGNAGWLSRILLARHLKDCPSCREFSASVGIVTRKLAPAILETPPDRVSRRLRQMGRDSLARVVERAGTLEFRRRIRQSLLGGFAGAAAALLLASLNPLASFGPAGSYPLLGATLQEELREMDDTDAPAAGTLEERLDGLEQKLRCLEIAIDEFNWNSLEGGNPCVDT
jgi:hypothetical protein